MKKTIILLSVVVLFIAGCKTTETTPYPQASAVFVGLGWKCDKKDAAKKGADIDVDTFFESVRYCYGDYMVSDPNPDGTSTKHFLYEPTRCKYAILKDSKATVNNVKNAIKYALTYEHAIIYFSCKATQVAAEDQDETDGLDECLVLYDGLLKDNDIWTMLNEAKGRVFIVFDTGHSETMFKLNGGDSEGSLLVDLVDDSKFKTDTSNGGLNMVCWSACLDDEEIDERRIGSRLTNSFYFKMDKWYTYDDIFDKIQSKLSGRQKIKKTVIGEDFSSNSMFR